MTRLHSAMLRAAALLAPGEQRAEWFAEWRAELDYVTHGRWRFCLGAFCDAFWLRRNLTAPNAAGMFRVESPVRCILLLAILAAVSVFGALRRPAARDLFLPSPYSDARSLAMISAAGRYYAETPTVTIERYRALVHGAKQRFDGIAFYRPLSLRVDSATLSVAVATENLLPLLQIPIALRGPSSLVLSDDAWRRHFAADPQIVGRTVQVGGEQAVVAAVIPGKLWRLPGSAAAWLLQDQAHLDQLPARTAGFVLGRIASSASQTPPAREWTLLLTHAGRGADRFEVSSLDKGPMLLVYLFAMAVAWLIVSATTGLGLGDYPANRHALPGAIRLRRWFFLGVKIALLIPIVCCGGALFSIRMEPHGVIALSFVAFRWALIDQRGRCPVCLRLLANPTRIGGPSQTFLEWYGTELICVQGHGLLYVPEIPSSCYSVQRWQYLDASWSSLFS